MKATAKYIRISPRKLTLLAKSIRSMTPVSAVETLKHMNKSGSKPLLKVIQSAVTNAKQASISVDNLTFEHIQVLPASAMKRYRAVSRGMAHNYKKRMSHIKIVLGVNKEKNDNKNTEKEIKKK